MSIFAPKPAFLIAGILLLSACEKNEFTVPVPVGGGGSGYSDAPSRSAPIVPPVTNQHPMIDNPDNPRETDLEDVYAVDEYEAQQKCEREARRRTNRTAIVRVKSVKQVTKRPYKNGTYKFECQLEIEYQ